MGGPHMRAQAHYATASAPHPAPVQALCAACMWSPVRTDHVEGVLEGARQRSTALLMLVPAHGGNI